MNGRHSSATMKLRKHTPFAISAIRPSIPFHTISSGPQIQSIGIVLWFLPKRNHLIGWRWRLNHSNTLSLSRTVRDLIWKMPLTRLMLSDLPPMNFGNRHWKATMWMSGLQSTQLGTCGRCERTLRHISAKSPIAFQKYQAVHYPMQRCFMMKKSKPS